MTETTDIKEIQEQLQKNKEKEIELKIKIPSGDEKTLYYKFNNLRYRQIQSAFYAFTTHEELLKNPAKTLPDLQKTLKEEAGYIAQALILYTKDEKGNINEYDGNINHHEPHKILNYANGQQYQILREVKQMFLGEFGIISTEFQDQFVSLTQLLIKSNPELIESMIQEGLEKNKVSPELKASIKDFMNVNSKNPSQEKSK